MESLGHTYRLGKCAFCGSMGWTIDGESECNCKGRRDYEQGIINEEDNDGKD